MTDSGKILYLDAAQRLNASQPEVDANAKEALDELVDVIIAAGMNPVTQLSGYLITEDPTYLPDGNARMLAHRVGRDKILETVLEMYLEYHLSDRADSGRGGEPKV